MKKILLFLCCFMGVLSLSFGTFPDVEITQTPTDVNNLGLSYDAWAGTQPQFTIGGWTSSIEMIQEETQNIQLTGLIPDIEASVGQNIEFSNFAASDYTYELQVFNLENNLMESKSLGPNDRWTISFDTQGTYTYKETTSGEIKSITVSNKLISTSKPVPLSFLSDGQNSLKVDIRYLDSLGVQQLKQPEPLEFNFDKYLNKITVEAPEISDSRTVPIKVSATDTSGKYYYLLNFEGNLASCGAFSQNEIFPFDNNGEVVLQNLNEGKNVVRVISTNGNDCTVFTGEARFEVTVDRNKPTLNLVEAYYGAQGNGGALTTDVFDDDLYINKDILHLVYDSNDAVNLQYIINGRGEGDLIDTNKIINYDLVQGVTADSDGKKLDVVVEVDPQFTTAEVLFTYGEREVKASKNSNKYSFSINLKDNSKPENKNFLLKVKEGDGPDVSQKEISIYDLAFEDKGEIKDVDLSEEGLFDFDIRLEDGDNSLLLIANDAAGNTQREYHNIFVSTAPPSFTELDPSSGESHQFFQSFKGITSKPNVQITAFTIPQGAKVPDTERNLQCSDYKQAYITSLGQLDNDVPRGPQLNLEEYQLSLSLESLLGAKVSTTSNDAGEFDLNVVLQDKRFDYGDVLDADQQRTDNQRVDSVSSENKVCFILADKFGNIEQREISMRLNTGNTLWVLSSLTSAPNSLYAAEMEGLTDQSGGTGAQFSVLATFEYVGDGKISSVQRPSISPDRSSSSGEGRGSIISSGMNFRMDTNTNELLVYFPVRVSPLGKDPLEYPDEMKFPFKMTLTYDIDDIEIPIDVQNPIFFDASVDVQRPLDHTKWLTPSAIESGLKFLNKSIRITERATKIMRYGAIVGTVACSVENLIYPWRLKALDEKDENYQKQKDELTKELYLVCDRVAGIPSPPACTGTTSVPNLEIAVDNSGTRLEDTSNQLQFRGADNEIVGEFESYRTSGGCDLDGDGENEGVWLSGKIAKYEEGYFDDSGFSGTKKITGYESLPKTCVPATLSGNNIKSLDLSSISNVCYKKGAPRFDDTKCAEFGFGDGLPGMNPGNSIFSSVKCGVLTDTYSHLQVALRVQKGIQNCFEQAKLGVFSGGYCERLVSQATCDLITNAILPEIVQYSRNDAIETEKNRNEPSAASFVSIITRNQKEFNKRYDDTVVDKAGISQSQIINKVCLGALTGDWSSLSDNILTAIDQNEVRPTFGPPFAESRLEGFNPLTGELAVKYLYTYAGISGGQDIKTKVTLICDSNAPNGEYCPNGVTESTSSGSRFKQKTLIIQRGQTEQRNEVILERDAQIWYNKIRFEHKYDLKSEQKTETEEFPIAHKSEMFAECTWSGGLYGAGADYASSGTVTDNSINVAGIVCEKLFTENSVLASVEIDKGKSKVLPEDQKLFYPGNTVFMNLGLKARGLSSDDEDLSLVYYRSCPGNVGETITQSEMSNSDPVVEKKLESEDLKSGFIQLDAYKVPEVGLAGAPNFYATFTIKKGESIIAVPIGATTIGRPNIDKAYYIDSSGKKQELNDIKNTWLSQNLQINGGNRGSDFSLLNKAQKELDGLDVTIVFKSAPQNTAFYVGEITGEDPKKEFKGRAIRVQDLTQVTSGTCQLFARVVPSNRVGDIDYKNFKTFSFDEQDGIITDVQASPVFQNSFAITTKSNTQTINHYLDSFKPSQGQSIGIDGDNIDISFVYQNSHNEKIDLSDKMTYSFNIEGFGIVASGPVELTGKETGEGMKNIEKGLYTFTIKGNEDLKKIQEALAASNEKDGYLEGQGGVPPSSLSATLALQLNIDENGQKKITKTKTIKFRVYSKKSKKTPNRLP